MGTCWQRDASETTSDVTRPIVFGEAITKSLNESGSTIGSISVFELYGEGALIIMRGIGETADAQERISRIDWNGKPAWRKRPENVSWRFRIQKGDPVKAFQNERKTYAMLTERGLPGPVILDSSDDQIVFLHAGDTLRSILMDDATTENTANAALMTAAKALADLHQNGIAHGRPAPRDICIDGDKVIFLDWELYAPKRNNENGFARDFIVFVFFSVVCFGGVPAAMPEVMQVYLRSAPCGVRERIRKNTTLLRVGQTLLKPLISKNKYKPDIAAIEPTIGFLRKHA